MTTSDEQPAAPEPGSAAWFDAAPEAGGPVLAGAIVHTPDGRVYRGDDLIIEVNERIDIPAVDPKGRAWIRGEIPTEDPGEYEMGPWKAAAMVEVRISEDESVAPVTAELTDGFGRIIRTDVVR